MNLSLSGRHALVTGASAGIGRATAMALADTSAEVSVLARSGDKLKELAVELGNLGASAVHVLIADLDNRRALAKLIDGHLAKHGPIHVLVNNAAGPPAGPLLEATDEAFLVAFGRHVLAPHLLVTRCLPGMKEAGYGRIINVVSTSVREPIEGLGVSNTVRGAVASWAKTLSRELPPGITINNVLPGYTDTDRLRQLAEDRARCTGRSAEEVLDAWRADTPEGRLATTAEIGGVIAFLASTAGAYLRGVSLPVDGGRLRSI